MRPSIDPHHPSCFLTAIKLSPQNRPRTLNSHPSSTPLRSLFLCSGLLPRHDSQCIRLEQRANVLAQLSLVNHFHRPCTNRARRPRYTRPRLQVGERHCHPSVSDRFLRVSPEKLDAIRIDPEEHLQRDERGPNISTNAPCIAPKCEKNRTWGSESSSTPLLVPASCGSA